MPSACILDSSPATPPPSLFTDLSLAVTTKHRSFEFQRPPCSTRCLGAAGNRGCRNDRRPASYPEYLQQHHLYRRQTRAQRGRRAHGEHLQHHSRHHMRAVGTGLVAGRDGRCTRHQRRAARGAGEREGFGARQLLPGEDPCGESDSATTKEPDGCRLPAWWKMENTAL